MANKKTAVPIASQPLQRWRLALGKYSDQSLARQGSCLSSSGQRMDAALEFLYGREYQGRGVRQPGGGGSLDPSQMQVPRWLNEVRELFPEDTREIIEREALERYELSELFQDPKLLESLEPNADLLKALLNQKGQLSDAVLSMVRQIIRKVVDELTQKLKQQVSQAFSGAINRQQHSPLKVAKNFDWRDTIRRNLKNVDPVTGKLIIEQLRFHSRLQRKLPWTVVLCVDQSASMTDAIIHAAVMSGILAGLPGVTLKLVVFDTSVVDLTDQLDDPVEVLMSVQLGGGTNIGQAVSYCEQLINQPRQTVFALISDFEEGAAPGPLFAAIKRLQEAGVTQIGLAALDDRANPYYDQRIAGRLVSLGMDIAALTPSQFAEWLAERMR